MPESFNTSAQELFARYNTGDYAAALAIAQDLALKYQDESDLTTFWQICLHTRLGDGQQAMQALKTAVQDGMWWSAAMLLEDEDLAPLQDLPEFISLVQICADRHTAAQAASKPELLTLVPEGDLPPRLPALVVLHGRRSNAGEVLPNWKPAAGQGWLVAIPQSSQVAGQGKFSWDDREIAREEIKNHLAILKRDYPLDPEKMILAGFSQGGAFAIELSLDAGLQSAGFLAVVPGMRQAEFLKEIIRSSRVAGVRGYLIAGEHDPRLEILVELYELMIRCGFPCKLEKHPHLGHAYPKDFQASLAAGLRFITGAN